MLVVVAVLIILSIAGLIAAVINGTPAPGYPRHGTFGVNGLDSSFIAWSCVAMCAVGLVLLFVDSRLERRRPPEREEAEHTAGDELFGESDVQRELKREEHG
jgi:hypothetical protein